MASAICHLAAGIIYGEMEIVVREYMRKSIDTMCSDTIHRNDSARTPSNTSLGRGVPRINTWDAKARRSKILAPIA